VIALNAAQYFSALLSAGKHQTGIQRIAAKMSGTDDVPHGASVADFAMAGAFNGISVLLSLLPGAGNASRQSAW
jgi:hypothetical protein